MTSTEVPHTIRTARRVAAVSKRALSAAAFGYVRLSQDAAEQLSIDRQIIGIKDTNRRLGLPDPIIFVDQGKKGQNNDRDGFQQLFAAFADNYGATCTFETLDRAFRSLTSYAEFQAKSSEHAIRLYNRNGFLAPEMLPIEATISVTELKKLRLRSEYKLRQMRIEGILHTTPNYGYMKVGKTMVPDPDQIANVRLMFDLAAANLTCGDIVKVLHERGIRAPRGGEMWADSTVRNILTHPVYVGTTAYWRHEAA